ncbi:MAG: class I SAM-dependent methyltransferase [Planctomycetota bacterium]
MTKSTDEAPVPTLDRIALKARQRTAWQSGDYAVIGTTLQPVGERLCEAVDVRAGERLLDVAAGNGNASLAAARRHAEVVSTDYVAALLERGRARATADGLAIEFRDADAEALPFADGTFDVVLSTFGVMFTPDQERAAAELLRVCRPGGRIGLANWTPEGFLGQLFRTLARHVPPAAGVRSPMQWGTQARLAELFGAGASIVATARTFEFHYRSAAHFLEVFRTWYGPMGKAFAALDESGQRALADDLHELLQRSHRGGPGLAVPSEYLEVVVKRH